jgi:hypothetical protein
VQVILLGPDRDVADRLTAVGQHHAQVDPNATSIKVKQHPASATTTERSWADAQLVHMYDF